MSARPAHARTFAGALSLGGLLVASSAGANDADAAKLVFLAVGPPLTADVALLVYDSVTAARGREPSETALWVETIGSLPQTIALDVVLTVASTYDDAEILVPLTIGPAMLAGALTAHGIVGLADDEADPGWLFLSASAFGIDSALSFGALGAALCGGLPRPPTAITEMVATTPVVLGSVAQLRLGSDHRPEAVMTLSWSSLLWLHGAAALALPRYQVGRQESPLKRWLMVTPASLADLRGPIPGVSLVGRF